jgi:glycosyltransferase involved in cell wall biosynthesis
LFISHDAGRTGAPIWLLTFVKWLANQADIQFDILLKKDGQLRGDFEKLARTYLLKSDRIVQTSPPPPIYPPKSRLTQIVNRLLRRFFSRNKDADGDEIQIANYDLIYSNTVTNGHLLNRLAPFHCPVITHVHELQHWFERSGSENLEFVKKYSDSYIAASAAVSSYLSGVVGIPSEIIHTVHSFTELPKTLDPESAGKRIRDKLAISPEAFVIVGSGHETWRKGKDLFVALCQALVSLEPSTDFQFLWVGGWEGSSHEAEISHLVTSSQLTRHITFVGQVDNPIDYFCAANCFAMVSREDPFPLVCLEAASVGVPILCFREAGGMPEFVDGDAGFTVDYCDVAAMAHRILEISRNPKLAQELGRVASQKARGKFCAEVGSKKVKTVLDFTLKQLPDRPHPASHSGSQR